MSSTPKNKIIQLFEWFGFIPYEETDTQVYGTCPFCFKEKKFYINKETGQWSCKAGSCDRSGNQYTFLSQWYSLSREVATADEWARFGKDRGIDPDKLKAAGFVYNRPAGRWVIPIYSITRTLCDFWLYKPGQPVIGLPGFSVHILGIAALTEDENDRTVYLCEGPFDTICLRDMVKDAIVLGIPGTGTFKPEWCAHFSGRRVVICYDNDDAGRKGVVRVGEKLSGIADSVSYLEWPDHFPSGYDIRDLYIDGQSEYFIRTHTVPYVPEKKSGSASDESGKNEPLDPPDTLRKNKAADKPPFQKVIDAYAKHLYMTPDYELAIRVSYATILSEYIPGDPLWMYLVAPPSTGKTVILLSFSGSPKHCVPLSTLRPAALVSGWRSADGSDPSVIPRLNGRTLVLKDMTEVLDANRTTRDDIYSIMRGAYDGTVEQTYGNGITRRYQNVHFSVLAGVTQKIYAERSASLGERFMMLHIVKGNNHEEADQVILRALANVGQDSVIAQQLAETASTYLSYGLSEEELNEAFESSTMEYDIRITNLAQLVGMLRGQVDKDQRGDILLYRPQYEMGARLAKQFKKLAIALSLLEDPIGINEAVYDRVVRVAFDTCIGFNLEILQTLILEDKLDILIMSQMTGIPLTTLRTRLDDMMDLEILCRSEITPLLPERERGRPAFEYQLSNKAKTLWRRAGLTKDHVNSDHLKRIEIGKRRK